MIHEVFHLMGAVAACAPNQGRGAHVVDHDLDIMSNSTAPHWEWTYIDYGNDDYYGHGRSDCVDISTSPYFEPAFLSSRAKNRTGALAVEGLRPDSRPTVTGESPRTPARPSWSAQIVHQ